MLLILIFLFCTNLAYTQKSILLFPDSLLHLLRLPLSLFSRSLFGNVHKSCFLPSLWNFSALPSGQIYRIRPINPMYNTIFAMATLLNYAKQSGSFLQYSLPFGLHLGKLLHPDEIGNGRRPWKVGLHVERSGGHENELCFPFPLTIWTLPP